MKHIYNNENLIFIKNILIQKEVKEDCNNFNIDDVTISFYETCLNKIVEKFGKIPGILAIYQFGSISAIGNSDIDLIFVIEPDKKISSKIFQTFEDKFSFKEKYVLYQHTPLIIGEKIIENINYVRECKNVRLLYGENYTFNDVDNILVLLYMLIDLITEYYPFTFLTKKLTARSEFQYINAFRYVYSLFIVVISEFEVSLNLNSVEYEEVQNILDKNNLYRKEYKNRCDSEVRKFFYYAKKRFLDILKKMNLVIDNLLITKLYVNNNVLKCKYLIGQRVFNRFCKQLYYTMNFFGKEIIYGQYPLNYLLFFRFKNVLPTNLLKAVKERDFYVDAYINFVKNYAFGRSLYFPWRKRNDWKTVVKQIIGAVNISI